MLIKLFSLLVIKWVSKIVCVHVRVCVSVCVCARVRVCLHLYL